jgi:hypothetical protein
MTIAAMKQALEALTEHGAPYLRHGVDWDNAITVLRAAIAEQEKCEPVAWTTMPEAEDWNFVSGTKNPNGKMVGEWHPLYTHPAPVPAGWQLVPVEPTEAMIRASHGLASVVSYSNGHHAYIPIAYKAMIAAAPKPGEMK